MSCTWFEFVEQQRREAEVASVGDERAEVLSGDAAEVAESERPQRARRQRLGTIVAVCVVAGLVACGGVVTAVLVRHGGAVSSAASGEATESLSSSVVVEPVGAVYAGSQCGDAVSGDVQVADVSDLRGTVVAFEQAYFSRDAVALRKVVAPGTALAGANWEERLPEYAPEGTQWCIRMEPPEGDSVRASLTVVGGDGLQKVYEQTIRGEQSDSGWLLTEFSSNT